MHKKEMERRREGLETFGTALWLLMDFLWMLGQEGSAGVVGGTALAIHVIVFRYVPLSLAEMAVAGSVLCWLLMNFFWMLGETHEWPRALLVARAAGIGGFALLGISVWRGGLWGPVAHRFRRFRFRRTTED